MGAMLLLVHLWYVSMDGMDACMHGWMDVITYVRIFMYVCIEVCMKVTMYVYIPTTLSPVDFHMQVLEVVPKAEASTMNAFGFLYENYDTGTNIGNSTFTTVINIIIVTSNLNKVVVVVVVVEHRYHYQWIKTSCRVQKQQKQQQQ